jgi:hypothetical protein
MNNAGRSFSSSAPLIRPFVSSTQPRTASVTSPSRPSRSFQTASNASSVLGGEKSRNGQSSGTNNVVPGLEVTNRLNNQHATVQGSLTSHRGIIPNTPKIDDLRCIFCYQFPIEGSKGVIICVTCHRPAHEEEYAKWRATSTICSYCNSSTNGNLRLSEKEYSKIVDWGKHGFK